MRTAELFGVSFALGAFFAGMVVKESDSSRRAERELKPLEDLFSVLFFVAVGMMFDPAVLLNQPLRVLVVIAIIVVGRFWAALGIVLVLNSALGTALTVAVALAQIGEFSFILAWLGVRLGLLPPDGQNLIVAGALLSIAVNPLEFRVVRKWSLFEQPGDAPLPAEPAAENVEAFAPHSIQETSLSKSRPTSPGSPYPRCSMSGEPLQPPIRTLVANETTRASLSLDHDQHNYRTGRPVSSRSVNAAPTVAHRSQSISSSFVRPSESMIYMAIIHLILERNENAIS
jgi:hypothetical protein